MNECIRTVFLCRSESYPLPEVARLTGLPIRKLRREVAAGDRDATKMGRLWRFTWRQVVFIALERWTLAEIHEALGADAAKVLPPLLALRSVTVCLPEYMLRALETIAAANETTLDDAIHGELIDFAGSISGREIEASVPGYQRAYLFPSRE